ncbi:MAG: sulfiredoxin [Phormidesmis sp.]
MVQTKEIPIQQIRRPLYRQNDPDKVKALMASIADIGLQEPIDVLEVEGEYYGFSGCHRYEACSRLGHQTILARVRRAPKSVLKMHLA